MYQHEAARIEASEKSLGTVAAGISRVATDDTQHGGPVGKGGTDCSFVFHLDGKKISDFRKARKAACTNAGLSGLLIHDLRRCAARNMSRAGVSEQAAMKVTGHKTPSMYRRYRIIDEQEIREALEKTQDHLAATKESKVAAIGRVGA